ncbi:uncharacterized protein TNCV_5074781 [Trichonephila clavipes]|nr:uncharacterized protein TNCV_5074781 [Trichonephila clavipes]
MEPKRAVTCMVFQAATNDGRNLDPSFDEFRGPRSHTVIRVGQTLNSNIYCQQLERLNLVTEQKRPELADRRGVVFHQDNARPHTSAATHQKLWELDWKVLMYLPYNPDLAPNDYLLFLVLKNFHSDKELG